MEKITAWWKRSAARPAAEAAPQPPENRLALVLAVSQAVAASLDLDQVLEAVHQQISRVFDTANFYIATYEQESDEWATALHLEGGQRQPPIRRRVGSGLTGHVIRTRQPLLFRSAQESAAFEESQGVEIVGERPQSWMGVPLVAGDQVVGVMAIQNYERANLYDEQDLAFFSTVAGQVAVAIKNARLYQQVRDRADETALLYKINHSLGTTVSLRETMEVLLQNLQDILPLDGGEVCLYDPERQVFSAQVSLGETVRTASAQTYTLADGYTGWIGRNRQPLLIDDCAAFTEVRPVREEAIVSGGLGAYLGAPMLIGDRLIGTLELFSRRPRAFSQAHLHLLDLVAGQAAVAIERARLFEELSQRLQEARLLFDVSQGVVSALNLDQVLNMIMRACVQAVPACEKGSLYLLDEGARELRIRAAAGYSPETVQAARVKVGQGPAGKAVQTGEPVIVEDARGVLGAYQVGLAEFADVRSLVCAPVRARDRAIGALCLDNLRSAGAFGQRDVEILSAFAGQAAVAIENARLYEQLHRQVDSLRQLTGDLLQASAETQALVQTSTETIEALEKRSRAIGPFVAQLEQFAEQTDLLALNAAIEAAHAGEHGLGFAVVAEEVRRLAESSSQAAGEIAALNQQILAETQQVVQWMERVRQAVERTAERMKAEG